MTALPPPSRRFVLIIDLAPGSATITDVPHTVDDPHTPVTDRRTRRASIDILRSRRSPLMSRRYSMRLASTIAFATAISCARAPLERICPELQAGDLVVTEIRGKQADVDTYGEWIELYNATDEAIALGGISVDLFKLDGSGDFHFIIRDGDVEIPPGGYAVLAGAIAADKAFTSYAYDDDEHGSLYAGAFVEVYSCELEIDSMFYRSLPDLGTLTLDGAAEPNAETNNSTDDPIWCADTTPADPNEPQIELGIRGTPGEANRPCP